MISRTWLYILTYLGILVWLLPPIKQYKTKYFLFFLLLGLTDPLAVFYETIVNPHNNHIVSIIMGNLLLTSLFSLKSLKKYFYVFAIIFTSTIIAHFEMTPMHELVFISLLNFLIFIKILSDFIYKILETETFDFFLFVFILYQVSLVAKAAILVTGSVHNYIFFSIQIISRYW
jgi:hypothetical protein